MVKHVRPILSGIPRDFAGRVDFDWHHLADFAALDDDDCRADAAALAAAILAASDVLANERIVVGDICSRDDVCRFYGESEPSR